MSALPQPKQYEIFDSSLEHEAFHDPTRPGFFSILHSTHDAGKRQRSYKLADMPTIIELLDKTRDTWISQAEFTKPNRRVVNLWRLGLCFVDLDTYTIGMTGDPEKLAQHLVIHCQEEGVPPPSLVVFSGRGLQAKWLLENAIPRQALPRWNLCQRVLVDKLASFGADANAKDASRVLRLVGAVNTKSGEVARVVHVTEENGQPVRYGFEYLCEWLLPVARETIERERQQWAVEKAARAARRQQMVLLPGGRQINGLRGFSGRELAWHRLEDLRKLAELRGGVDEGQRMLMLFWQLNFMLLSGSTNTGQMWYEAQALARAIDPQWHHDKSALSTLYNKAKAFEAGERVEWQGKSYPALYTPRNDHLIDAFRITDDEQRELKTIITPGMARERDAARKKAKRAAAGAVDRATYEANSASRLKPWERLGMSRATWYRKGQPQPVEKSGYPQVDNVRNA